MKKETIVLIGGLPRAGNHLLRGLLDGHQSLLMPPDEDYFVRTLARNTFYRLQGWFSSKKQAPSFYRIMQNNGFFERLNAGQGGDSHNTEPVLNLENYYAYVGQHHKRFSSKSLYHTHCEALTRALLIDNLDSSALKVIFCVLYPLSNDVLNMSSLLSKYYSLKALFIFRNPLAIYCSAKKRNYYEKGKIDVFCRAFNKYYEDIALLKKKHTGNILNLSFESLVTNTELVMRRVASFLSIPYTDSMMRVTQNGKESISNSSFDERKGIDTHVVDRYKEKLTTEEITCITTMCGPKESVHII